MTSSTRHENAWDAEGNKELERFRGIRQLTNHWARPAGPRSYYWYLTFENASNLQSLARRCQEQVLFPYYDLTPANDLHMTLDRVAFEGDATPDQIHAIENVALRACARKSPFDMAVGFLGGTSGAIGFSAFPVEPIRSLRETLREATLSVYPNAPISGSEFHPHVAIGYCNADLPAEQAVALIEKLHSLPSVHVAVKSATLVLLERRQRAYSWQAIARIPLSG